MLCESRALNPEINVTKPEMYQGIKLTEYVTLQNKFAQNNC